MKGLNYVAMAPGIAADPKILTMASRLKKDRYWVAGHFPAFLGQVAEHAPTGNLAGIPEELLDIWAGGVAGWGAAILDLLCVDGQIVAWSRYNGRALDRLQKERTRKAEYREARRGRSADCPGDSPRTGRTLSADNTGTGTGTGTIPTTTTKTTHGPAAVASVADEFEIAWRAYPPRPNNSKAKALRAYVARRRAGHSAERLLDGVKAYRAYVEREGTEPRFVKSAATFFGPDEHWLADYTPTTTRGASPRLSPGEALLAMAAAQDAERRIA